MNSVNVSLKVKKKLMMECSCYDFRSPCQYGADLERFEFNPKMHTTLFHQALQLMTRSEKVQL